jgi:peptidoglycan hydrolase-like protein with peptidoglycan-binding domain
MSEKTGPRTTASLVTRAGVAALTAAGCASIVVNALFLQPGLVKRVAGDGISVTGEDVARNNVDAPVTRISVTPEGTLLRRLSAQGDPLVREIQTELQRLGFYDGLRDGMVGARTRAAVTAYQRANDLSLTGEASHQLRDHILFAKQLAAAATYTASVAVPAPSEDVRRVQIALNALGFDAGPADGMPGDKTREAIRAFEAYRGLDKTGAVTATLARELGITLAAGG